MLKRVYLFLFLLLSSAIIYSQSWQPVTSPPDFLTDHSYGFSLDGYGYLVAGTTEFDGPTDAFLQYDPYTDTWTYLDSFPGPARGYGIGDVWEGKAYFGFGTSVDSLLRDMWVYDPDSSRWTALASCPCEPRLHPSFVANNGKIFVGLGNNNNGNLNDWWEYDIATDTWSAKPDFPGLIRHHPYMFSIGDYVYTGFGHGNGAIYKDWYRYDPVTEEWAAMADLPGEGRVAGTQFSYNGIGYVLSGDGDDHYSMETGEFWAYDPLADAWQELPPHPGKSRWAPSSFILNGDVYLFNGTAYFDAVGSVYQSEGYKFSLDSLSTSIIEVGEQHALSIFPNPFTSSFTIALDEVIHGEVRLYSIDNKLVHQQKLNRSPIDAASLREGIYRVEVQDGNTVYSRLVIKH